MSEQSIHQLHMKRLKGLLELFSRRLIVCVKSHRDQSSGHNRVLGVTPGQVNCKQEPSAIAIGVLSKIYNFYLNRLR